MLLRKHIYLGGLRNFLKSFRGQGCKLLLQIFIFIQLNNRQLLFPRSPPLLSQKCRQGSEIPRTILSHYHLTQKRALQLIIIIIITIKLLLSLGSNKAAMSRKNKK